MEKSKNPFVQSLRELRDPRCLVVTALLIALNVALDLLNIRIWLTPELRFGVSFVLNASIAMLYGPSVGMMAGFCTDIMGYFVNPAGGGYFPGYTLTAILGGMLYGLWLYPRRPSKLRVIGAKTSINLICNIGLNTFWLALTGGKAMALLLPARALKNLVLLPFEAVLLYIITTLVLKVYHQTTRPAPAAK